MGYEVIQEKHVLEEGWSKRSEVVLQIVTIRFCITGLNSSVHSLGWRYHVRQYPSDSLLGHNDKNEAILTLLHNPICITQNQYCFTLLLLSVRQTELFFAVHLSLSRESRELRCPLRSGETEAQVLTTVTGEINVRHKQNLSLLTVPLYPLGSQAKVEKWLACSVTQQLFLPQQLASWATTNNCLYVICTCVRLPRNSR